MTTQTPALAWTRSPDGVYIAAGTRRPGDDAFTDRSWHVWKLPNRRWIIESFKTTRQRSTYSFSLEPVAVKGTRHGDAHTLREAKELVASADRFLSTPPTPQELVQQAELVYESLRAAVQQITRRTT